MTKPIEIHQQLLPFSHSFGTCCLVPGTSYAVEIFPTLLRCYDLSSLRKTLVKEVRIPLKGPVIPFTVAQDLERGEVKVLGRQANGDYFSYSLNSQMHLHFHKGFPDHKDLVLIEDLPKVELSKERLFLGATKKQEWEKIKARSDLREILPLWFRLGSYVKGDEKVSSKEGIFSLLERCEKTIAKKEHDKLFLHFLTLFLVFFEKMLVPRLVDTEYQGIIPAMALPKMLSPMLLLQQSSRLIRSLFIHSDERSVSFLPHLPPECPSGKMTNISIFPFGECEFEWTKKKIRRLIVRSSYEGDVLCTFPKEIKSCRLRTHLKEKGSIVSLPISLEFLSGKTYFFDRFEK